MAHGLGKVRMENMFKYDKKLAYPINITKKDLKMAKYLITQFGGPNGELSAAMRYFSQKFTMPDDKGRALLNDIATEELGHVEMICTMVHQLTKNATIDELEKAGCDVTLLEIEDADHADIRFFQKEIWQEIIAFFKMKFDVLDERKQVGKNL